MVLPEIRARRWVLVAEAGRGLGLSDQCELLGVAAMLPLATAIKRDYFGLTTDALDD